MTNKERLKQARVKEVKKLFAEREFARIEMTKLETPNIVEIDSDSDLDFLEEALQEHGLLSPISVVGPYENGIFKVVEGARRIKALRNLMSNGLIPCYIVDKAVSDKDLKIYALAANMVHRNNDNSLCVQYTQMLYEECIQGILPKCTIVPKLAELTGITERQSRKYVNIYENGSQNVIRNVSASKLPVNTADAIAKVCPNEEAQNDVAEMYMNAPQGEKKEILDGLKDCIRKEKPVTDAVDFQKEIHDKKTQRYVEEIIKSMEMLKTTAKKEDVRDLVRYCKRFIKFYK